MTPKDAYWHIEKGMQAGHNPNTCPHCNKALAILRALIGGPTVQEVREEIEKELANYKRFGAERDAYSVGVIDNLEALRDFIDRKEA